MATRRIVAPPESCFDPIHGEAVRESVSRQLERVLSSPLFKNSKRYPVLLRFVVESTLAGRAEELKERTLGIEVFGRSPDYDSNLDPVVRTSAGEVRKRLAQYYHQPEHRREIQIELPTGSYIPLFRFPEIAEQAEEKQNGSPANARDARSWMVFLAASLLLLIVAGAGVWFRRESWRSPLDQFWTLDSSKPVLLCIGDPQEYYGGSQDLPKSGQLNSSSTVPTLMSYHMAGRGNVALSDATTAARLAGLFEARDTAFELRSESSTTLDDLRKGPVVLIGAFNNQWTLRLSQQLRFYFVADNEKGFGQVRDRQDPSQHTWIVHGYKSYLEQTEDYAVVSRVRDATTGEFVIIAAGLGKYGTAAAGEFLTKPEYFNEIARKAPQHWRDRDMEVVIETPVIEGHSGRPHIVSTHFW